MSRNYVSTFVLGHKCLWRISCDIGTPKLIEEFITESCSQLIPFLSSSALYCTYIPTKPDFIFDDYFSLAISEELSFQSNFIFPHWTLTYDQFYRILIYWFFLIILLCLCTKLFSYKSFFTDEIFLHCTQQIIGIFFQRVT